MNKADFLRWFNRGFWKAFSRSTFPIEIPKTPTEKAALVESVYDDIASARYAPGIPETELVMNKGHGVARTIPVFSIRDYCVYYFCIKELEDVLCGNRTPNTFGGWTLGGQLRVRENDEIESDATAYGRYSFNPQAWTHAFGEFNALLFAQLDLGHYAYVLQLDLSNFYDCVRLDILERWIREHSPPEKGWVIALLFYLLNHWNRRNTGLHPQAVGLPQDALADCSRILSNFYLQKYDQFASGICTQAGATYFRYADDQMILLNDPSKIDNLLLLLTRNLDRFGLRVNQKKVKLWQTPELIRHRCREIQAIFATKGDNQNTALVRKFVDAYLALTPTELDGTWNGGMPLLNRLLWAKLDSLPRSLFNRMMVRLTAERFLLHADAQKLKRLSKLNALRTSPIDLDKRIRTIARRTVHNAFYHEARSFAQEIGNAILQTFLVERIDELSRIMQSNIVE
ncbi:MAG: reverse transcriptase domain-containing protein [Candidatus Nitrotoga sp.]|nr:reverse transcriptase domain-containing protein [Candidatus Nitrotoga sp.]MDP1854926.1 reverse transcriptase domain-containing protein [Candidatus Nitrotoga sp.]